MRPGKKYRAFGREATLSEWQEAVAKKTGKRLSDYILTHRFRYLKRTRPELTDQQALEIAIKRMCEQLRKASA